jgi:hypothetical protein
MENANRERTKSNIYPQDYNEQKIALEHIAILRKNASLHILM